jgi:hypothetical protein
MTLTYIYKEADPLGSASCVLQGGIELSEGSARVPLLLDLHRDSNMGLRCSFIVPLALAWDV